MRLNVLLFLGGIGIRLTAGFNLEGTFRESQNTQVKKFELNLSWETRAPDGIPRKQMLVNGQFPGPPLLLDEGDNVEVTVNNLMPFNTTIHYHGIEQLGTPWSDGVPGLSQKLIHPGNKFVSKFTVTQYGTYWYHSHSRGQIMDGLYGPIYVRPKSIPEDTLRTITDDLIQQAQIKAAIESPRLMVISDWFHITSEQLRDIALSANIDTLCVDSILINGKGRVNCRDPAYLTSMLPAQVTPVLQGMNLTKKGCLPLENTYAQTSSAHDFSDVPASLFNECQATDSSQEIIEVNALHGWESLNFIGSASVSAPTVSINNHSLWVYEIDGLYIKPTQVDALTIQNGARYSCLVQLNQVPGDYPIVVANSGLNQKIAGFGTLSYANGNPHIASSPSVNYGGVSTSPNVALLNETAVEMLYPSQPSQEVDETYILTAGRFENAWKWSLDENHAYSLALEAEKPMLWDPLSAAKSPLVITTKNNTWVDIIFSMAANKSSLQPPHPIHKHSNQFYVIGSGSGPFEWTSVKEAAEASPASFNLVNPPVRDTFSTPAALEMQSWMAIRYHVENPGAFLLHCHIDPHLTGGMALAILDGVDAWPTIPSQYGPGTHWGKVDS